ncbi:MAG: ABC transporter permease [Terracidiphilus sp.]
MLLQNAMHDLRFALRQLRKDLGFTALAVGTLALAITANLTIFSWINSTLLNPIPGIAHTSDMITIMRGDRSEHPTPPFSYLDLADLRNSTHSFSGLIGYHDDYMSITGSGQPERIYGTLASSDYFEVLGVRPILGRSLLPALATERTGTAEAVLAYDLWQKRYGGDLGIVGKTIQINLHPYTIVGVAPRGFQGCKSGLRSDIWIPLGLDKLIWGSNRINERDTLWLNVLGKLAPGVDRVQAESELNVLMQHIAARFPDQHLGPNNISSDPLWRSPFGANVYLFGTLPMLLVLAGALLLLACANVANLLLVRSVGRRREMAIRLSMGASRWRVVRQLLVENLFIALAGGAVALMLTLWTAGTMSAFLPPTTLPLTLNGHVDSSVFLATLLVSVLTAVVAGAIPALRASRLSPVSVLKDEALSTTGGLSKSRLTGGLVIAQIALSLLLLTCAGLFVRSLQNAQHSAVGFDPDHVLLTTYDLDPVGYTGTTGTEFDRRLLERVKALPGVQSATLADFAPLNFTIHSDFVQPEGYVPHLHESMEVDRGLVGPGYLETLRTPLIAGRDFTAQDNATSMPAAIVNQALVDRYWPGQNAIGKRIQVVGGWCTVVGVASNGKYRRMTYDPAPLVLMPLLQRYTSQVILHVRVNGDPQVFASAVERTAHGLNADLPLYNQTTLRENMQMGSVFERIAAAFAGSFGILALILAAVGIYGVVAYTTRQRTHEIGIRMALGAGQGDVFRSVLGLGARLALFGLIAGLVASFAFTRFLRGMLFGVAAVDWITFASVAAVLFLVALAACYFPARRAAAVEPMQALRTE